MNKIVDIEVDTQVQVTSVVSRKTPMPTIHFIRYESFKPASLFIVQKSTSYRVYNVLYRGT